MQARMGEAMFVADGTPESTLVATSVWRAARMCLVTPILLHPKHRLFGFAGPDPRGIQLSHDSWKLFNAGGCDGGNTVDRSGGTYIFIAFILCAAHSLNIGKYDCGAMQIACVYARFDSLS
jgi:hypothetical protein